jgi:carboxylesterase type B
VLVWFHGGAFLYGAGSSYNGAALARRGDVLVVTVNYRLGLFGWLRGIDVAAVNRQQRTVRSVGRTRVGA